MKGYLITIEGSDGVGKSTQAELLKKYLESKKMKVQLLREPGDTITGEAIRSILKDIKYKNKDDMTELMLFEAARCELYNKKIKPMLDSGYVVILDRYIDSTIAYQGYGRGLNIDRITLLNNIATEGRKPDLTILLNMNPDKAFERRNGPDVNDNIEMAGKEFYKRVNKGFKELSLNNYDRIVEVNADDDPKHISDTINQIVLNRL